MKLNIGDSVRFLNESIEGTISGILSQGRVEVLDSHGFTHTTEEKYLVRVEFTMENSRDESSTSKPSVTLTETVTPHAKSKIPIIASLEDDNTIYAAIRLLDEKNPLTTDIELYLVNNTDFDLAFTCLKRMESIRIGVHSATLASHQDLQLGVFSQDELSRFEGFEFQFLFFMKNEFKPKPPDTKLLQFNSTDFMNTEYRRKLFDRDDMVLLMPLHEVKPISAVDILSLIEKYKEKRQEEEARTSKKNPGAKQNKFVVLTRQKVVDLHIEELMKDHSGMNNAQIISYQINYFMSEMDKALIDKLHKITFIHGIGAGVLRSAIREELKRFPNIRYNDAPIEKYGNGATEVEFV
jgi:hypothetical protein